MTHSTVHVNLETMYTESQKSKYCVVHLHEQPKLATVADVERRVEVATSIGYRSRWSVFNDECCIIL